MEKSYKKCCNYDITKLKVKKYLKSFEISKQKNSKNYEILFSNHENRWECTKRSKNTRK